ALAGTPATRLFDFWSVLFFQQSIFLIFQPCWNSSSLAPPSPFNITHKKSRQEKISCLPEIIF
ncbi:MAG: hypothetical protein ACFNJR_07080, partial [Segatella oulorum]|uniref:hypothetical protein n=1 Tax=Segatella oulorum TaxID=28136 RepID=UPI00360FAAB4